MSIKRPVIFPKKEGGGRGSGIVDPTITLMKRFGGLAAIPKEELDQYGLFRVCRGNNSFSLLKKDDYNHLMKFAHILTAENGPYSGYISANERQDVIDFIFSRTTSFSIARAKQAVGRAIRMKEAGCPPIYQLDEAGKKRVNLVDLSPELIERTSFPVIDYLLKFVSGSFFTDRKEIAFKNCREGNRLSLQKYKIAILPAEISDILSFRAKAFRGDQVDIAVINEALYYAMNNFDIQEIDREKILDYMKAVASRLAEQIKALKPQDRQYQKYNPSDDFNFLNEKLWFINYSAEDVGRILADYFKSPQALKNEGLNARLYFLFPNKREELKGFLSMAREQARISQSQALLNELLNASVHEEVRITTDLLNKAKEEGVFDKAKLIIQKRLKNLSDKNQWLVMDGCETIGVKSNIAAGVFYLQEIKDILYQLRFSIVKKATDIEVYRWCNSKDGGTGKIFSGKFLGLSSDQMAVLSLAREKYFRGREENMKKAEKQN
ncbi:MAG: hypothetical protein ABIH50_03395 [bacterium]